MTDARRDAELDTLRQEYLAMERSVERYVTLYLSALAVGAAWLVGPSSVAPKEIISGNGGQSICAVLALALVNISLTCFMLFKGLQVHELMQFAVTRAEPGSTTWDWEVWRRESFSLTKPIRTVHYAITSGFPLLVSVGLLVVIGIAIFAAPVALVDPSAAPVVRTARTLWACVVALHLALLPVYVWLNAAGSARRWQVIQSSPGTRDPAVLHTLMMNARKAGARPSIRRFFRWRNLLARWRPPPRQ